jgi:sulfur carrier protein
VLNRVELVVQIVFNGQTREVSPGTTVAALLAELGLSPRQVAVEVNQELVPRARHDRHQLAQDDQLEVVTLVGGG